MSGIYRGPNGSATADALNIDGDKGDLTISNSGLEWTINPDVVTTTKLGGDITLAGKALLDDADASAQRTTLGLGDASTANIGSDVLAYDSNLQSFVDTFTLPTTDATNGFVLTTDGAGTLSLTAPGGIADDDYGDITVSTGATVWTVNNNAITTTKILDDNVTYAKIQNVSATDKILGRSSAGAGNIEEITCTSAGRALLDDVDASAQRTTLGLGSIATQGDGDKGEITVSGSGATWTIDNTVITGAKLSTTVLNDFSTSTPALDDFIPFVDITNSNSNAKATVENVVKAATNASGVAPIFPCRAWVNFNGTGTVAIRGSGNVSSITDNGTGDYTVNFTDALPDVNYSALVVGSGALGVTNAAWQCVENTPSNSSFSRTVSSFRINALNNTGGAAADGFSINVSIFR